MRYAYLLCLCLMAVAAGCSNQDEATLSAEAATLFDSAQQDAEAGRDDTAMLKILDVIDINQQRLQLAEEAGDDNLFESVALQQLDVLEMTVPQCVFTGQFQEAVRLARIQQKLTSTLKGKEHWAYVDATNAIERLEKLQTLDKSELQAYFRTVDSLVTAEELIAGDQAAEAKQLIEKSIATRKRLLGANYDGLARHLYMLGTSCGMLSDFENAETHLLESLSICRKRYPRDHPVTASTANGLGRLYSETADYEKSLTYLKECFEISRLSAGEISPSTAWALDDLGNTHAEMGNFPAAKAAIERSLEIRRELYGEEHSETATSQNDLGIVIARMGDYQTAEDLHLKSLKTREKILGESHADTLASMLNLSNVYANLAQYSRASNILQRHLKLSLELYGDEHPAVAQSATNLAILFEKKGDVVSAEPYYQQAFSLNQKIYGDQHPSTNGSRMNLAGLYSSMGDNKKSESLLRTCLKVATEIHGEEHPETALILCNLSAVLISTDNIREAENLAVKGLDIYENLPGYSQLESTNAMANLAQIYTVKQEYAKAAAMTKRAAKLTRDNVGDNHPATANALFAVAYTQMLAGNLDQVEPPLEKGAAIIRQYFDEKHQDMASYWGTRASLDWAHGNLATASQHFAKADAIYRRLAVEAALVQSERQQLKMAQQSMELFHLHLSMRLSKGDGADVDDLFEQSLRWKGGVLLRQRQMRQAANSQDAAGTIKKLQTVTMQLATLSRLTPQNAEAFAPWKKRTLQLTEEKERLERKFSQQTAGYRQNAEDITLDMILDALPGDSVLVNFLEFGKTTLESVDGKIASREYGPHLMAFVAQRGKPVQLVELAASDKINVAVDVWREGFGNSTQAKQAGDELRRSLWEPLEKYLADATTILVSTDGPLGRIPLGALPGRKSETYLLEDHRLAYVPVPQLIPELLEKKPARGGGLLTLGNVNYNKTDVVAQPETTELAVRARAPANRGGANWQALKGAAAEVEAIRKYHDEVFNEAKDGGTASLRGSGATEEQFRKQAPSYRHLHIATHGFFADPSHAGALSDDSGRGLLSAADQDSLRGYNPGLLSGLIFAGANQKPEVGKDDGILTAQEIAFIPLDDVELVTLSACETGLGQVAGGEGLLGVQRAFQVAGARSTLASLWKVPDEATRALMLRIYRNLWEKKISKLDAVREAQLYMLKNPGEAGELTRGDIRLGAPKPQDNPGRLPPWYWAAFILSGDWR